MNQEQSIVLRGFPGTREAILAFAERRLTKLHQVAMEATFNTWAVVDLLEALVGPITVSNPMQTRAIAQAKIETDKIDTRVLGHWLRLGYLPSVWTPDEATRSLLTAIWRSCANSRN